MPVAGSNKKGYWMQVINRKLRVERETYSGVCEMDVDRAVQRLLAGERVHVYSTHPTPARVQMALSVALGGDV